MPRKMIVELADGQRPVLTELPATNERQLQQKLTEHPELIPIEEFGWPGPLMVVGRENPLPSGSPDLVAITPDGKILVAEFKTGPQNPDFRAALAQAIDYGADLWRMTYDEFEEAVAKRYFAGSHCPLDAPTKGSRSLLAAAEATWGPTWDDEDRQEFVPRVTEALADGRFHFAVVAQRFTEPMRRTAEYLNATADTAGIYLVELIRFTDTTTGIDAYEARTVLKPGVEKVPPAPPPFPTNEPDPELRAWFEDLIAYCTGLGLTMGWGSLGTSIRINSVDTTEPLSIGWLYPSNATGIFGLTSATFGVDPRAAAKRPGLRPVLDRYTAALSALPGAEPVTSIDAYTFSPRQALANDQAIRAILERLVETQNAERRN